MHQSVEMMCGISTLNYHYEFPIIIDSIVMLFFNGYQSFIYSLKGC
jgi:hypothetical protein